MSGFLYARYYLRPKACSLEEWLKQHAYLVALPSAQDFLEIKAKGLSILVVLSLSDGRVSSAFAGCLTYERLYSYSTFEIVGNPPPKLYIVNNESLRHDTGLPEPILKHFPVVTER
jgi:hypothetical protein